MNGDVDVDSILDVDLARGPSGSSPLLVENSSPRVEVEVNEGVNVYVAVKDNVPVDVHVEVEVEAITPVEASNALCSTALEPDLFLFLKLAENGGRLGPRR